MISIIIPTLNESENLRLLLSDLLPQAAEKEIIVVDAESTDTTQNVAKDAGVKLLTSPRGRGQQLAQGVAASRGDLLLFLHADCRFPADGLSLLEQELEKNTKAIGGNFSLKFAGEDKFSRWLTGFYARIRKLGLYYGDSGIFIRSQSLHELGGINQLAMMEDYDLVKRMEKSSGKTLCIDAVTLVTSSRRFDGRSFVGIFSSWLMMHFFYWLGISGKTLARIYDSERCRN